MTFTPDAPLAMRTRHDVFAPAALRGANGGETRAERTTKFFTIWPPELKRTNPRDGETDAGLFGISLDYNNPMDIESFEGRISISGIDADQISVSLDRWQASEVFVSVRFEHATTYTVRIAAGVRDRGGRPLPAYEFSFTTREPGGWPYLALAAPASFSTFSAGRAQVLHYHVRRVSEVHFQLFRLSDSEAETLHRRGFIDDWWTDTTFWPAAEPLREWTEEIEQQLPDEARRYSTVLSGDNGLPKGPYFLAATPGPFRGGDPLDYQEKIVFSVVDTAIVTKLAADELIVWALDYDTGEPLDATAVSAALMEQAPLSPYKHATTDADGLARFPIRAKKVTGGLRTATTCCASTGRGASAWRPTWWYFGSSPWDLEVRAAPYFAGQRGHLFTERPIYRPGETVSYKGVVRDEDDASYAIPGADATFTVTIRDPRYENLPTTRVTLNEIGTFSGDFMLPADAPTGSLPRQRDRRGRHPRRQHALHRRGVPRAGIQGRGRGAQDGLPRRGDDRGRGAGELLLRRPRRRGRCRVDRPGMAHGHPRRGVRGLLLLERRHPLLGPGWLGLAAQQRRGAHDRRGRRPFRRARAA